VLLAPVYALGQQAGLIIPCRVFVMPLGKQDACAPIFMSALDAAPSLTVGLPPVYLPHPFTSSPFHLFTSSPLHPFFPELRLKLML
jgi:hypothetical protein